MITPQPVLELPTILDHSLNNGMLNHEEIKFLLGLSDQKDLERLFETARAVRSKHFHNKVFLYGFLYFSTFCRNDCNFCHFRSSNGNLDRYRKDEVEILKAAREMADAGVHLIDLTMGEDPYFFHSGDIGFKRLVKLVEIVQQETHLPVMISPGVVPDDVLKSLADKGTSFYACYQETHNRTLYKTLRTNQSFDERMGKKVTAKKLGMLIEEGLLSGVGESLDDLANSIDMMRALDADQVRVMTFVPQQGTPMAKITPPTNLRERVLIAVMRLVFPDRLIPASLDVDGLAGLKNRLDAGANVITSIVPPKSGLAGVANSTLDIEDARRTSASIAPILNDCGLETAQLDEYFLWMENRKKSTRHALQTNEPQGDLLCTASTTGY